MKWTHPIDEGKKFYVNVCNQETYHLFTLLFYSPCLLLRKNIIFSHPFFPVNVCYQEQNIIFSRSLFSSQEHKMSSFHTLIFQSMVVIKDKISSFHTPIFQPIFVIKEQTIIFSPHYFPVNICNQEQNIIFSHPYFQVNFVIKNKNNFFTLLFSSQYL